MMPRQGKLKFAAVTAAAGVLAACGGGGDDTPAPTPVVTTACAWDTTVALAYEEQRLTTPMPTGGANAPGTNTTPVAERIVTGAGFENFNPTFAAVLCPASGQTPV